MKKLSSFLALVIMTTSISVMGLAETPTDFNSNSFTTVSDATSKGTKAAKTFYTTCVQDNLDASDRVDFVTQFKKLGYTELGKNLDVSSSALNSLLKRSDITTLYHTGHGDVGLVATSDGALTTNNITTVNCKNFISATCLTLTSTAWKKKMSTNTENILGYTNYSYDITDNQIVKDFAAALGKGQSYIKAWYSSNIVQSLVNDRWCGYVREGSSIVEYSARTSVKPKSIASTTDFTIMGDSKNLKVATSLLNDKRTFDSEFANIKSNDLRVAENAAQDMTFYTNSKDFLEKTPISSTKALEIANKWLKKNIKLPSDAVQTTLTPIYASKDSEAPVTVAYIVRYTRKIDGMDLKSNGSQNHIALLVNGNTVTATSKIWPTITSVAKSIKASSNESILSVNAAISTASTAISQRIKSEKPVEIVDVNPCYGNDAGTIVPAYELIDSEGRSIIINAATAKLLP